MPMTPANQVLALLRTQPAVTCATWGFMCRGAPLSGALGGACTLTCTENNGVYKLEVTAGGTDWYIPYGASAVRYCDVPKGQPDGTLVVTFPMNGCALEVHAGPTPNHNRFYHDADGKHMPKLDTAAKARVDANMYEGVGARAAAVFKQYVANVDSEDVVGQNFEHTLICVKDGVLWNVYQTAVVTTMKKSDGSLNSWQIKDGPPVHVGVFGD
jgi:hypothetical protein